MPHALQDCAATATQHQHSAATHVQRGGQEARDAGLHDGHGQDVVDGGALVGVDGEHAVDELTQLLGARCGHGRVRAANDLAGGPTHNGGVHSRLQRPPKRRRCWL